MLKIVLISLVLLSFAFFFGIMLGSFLTRNSIIEELRQAQLKKEGSKQVDREKEEVLL
jgi:uncharacterized protein YneF (UPF0154 family)